MTTSPAPGILRVGTWNLEGRWTPGHAALLADSGVDVWLLTEVSEQMSMPGWQLALTEQRMAPRRHWAGVLTTLPLTALADPHPASALARVAGITFCSSVLPWRSCGTGDTWVGDRHSLKTAKAIETLLPVLRDAEGLVWGGDWNHALTGPEYAGSIAGRASIQQAIDAVQLQVPTAGLPHRIDGLLSIDHLAVGPGIDVTSASHLTAFAGGVALSDHDAYVVELAVADQS